MQIFSEARGSAVLKAALGSEDQRVDFTALRVLATWISRRAGRDPENGAEIDRGFVVSQAHA
jgi:hypothetical protein